MVSEQQQAAAANAQDVLLVTPQKDTGRLISDRNTLLPI